MNSPEAQGLDADELMARIRAEMARRRRPGRVPPRFMSSVVPPADVGAPIPTLPLPHLPKPALAAAQRYTMNDFLALHDRDFLEAAYRGVLKRAPDPSGEEHFLGSLRRGDLNKIEILGRLRYSPEGRKRKVPVRGLFSAFAVQQLYRIPVLGRGIATAVAILRLPLIVRNLQRLESYQHLRNAELENAIAGLSRAASGNEQALLHRIEFARGSIADSSRRIGAAVDALQQRQEELDGHWRRIADAVDATQQEIVAATERFMREGEQDRADIARNVADIDNIRAELSAKEVRLADLETTSRNHNARLTAIQELEKHISAAIETGGQLDRRLLAVEASERRVAALESAAIGWEQRLLEALTQIQATTQAHSGLRDIVAAIEARLQAEQGAAQTVRWRLTERLARLEGRLHEQSMLLGTTNGSPATERASKKKSASTPAVAAPASPRFEALYFAFEQRFRGTREEIRERLRYYLPLLRDSVVGREGAHVLDIGCGRGEWLELLRDEKITARGIDVNETMINECRERDLDVSLGDALALLKRLPDNSLGAVTGFHIIEHVSLEVLLELIEQAHRVVEPGGLVIFETPNPENIVVGACNFYVDPTHQRPLPPVMTQFLVEASGFNEVEIHRVNAHLLPKLFGEPAENDPPALRAAVQFLQSAFACAPDYSVVGRVA